MSRKEDEKIGIIDRCIEFINQCPKLSLSGIALLVIIVIPALLNWIPIESEWHSRASNEGWISFWGSYLGGVFGGAGTLIAVLITTRQAKKYQEENLKETRRIQEENLKESRRIQEENLKQLKIKNANEKINDLRSKLTLITRSKDIISKNNLFYRQDIDIYGLDLTIAIEYSKNIQEFHSTLIDQSGIVNMGNLRKEDIEVLELSIKLAKITDLILNYFIKNLKVKNDLEKDSIEKQLNESKEIHKEMTGRLANLSAQISKAINQCIDEKYKYLE